LIADAPAFRLLHALGPQPNSREDLSERRLVRGSCLASRLKVGAHELRVVGQAVLDGSIERGVDRDGIRSLSFRKWIVGTRARMGHRAEELGSPHGVALRD